MKRAEQYKEIIMTVAKQKDTINCLTVAEVFYNKKKAPSNHQIGQLLRNLCNEGKLSRNPTDCRYTMWEYQYAEVKQ